MMESGLGKSEKNARSRGGGEKMDERDEREKSDGGRTRERRG